MNDAITHAILILNNGGIVIYPTDTAFGIGCRIDDTAAVDRLFAIRKRPLTQAMPVLVSSMDMALTFFSNPTKNVRRLMKRFWPGALTIIYYGKKDMIYSPISGGTDTIGLRMPKHNVPLSIIEGIGVPILGPSANFHGKPTPYMFEDLDPELVALVDYIVPGECPLKQASTVVDCTVEPHKIVRQGTIILE